MEIFNSQAATLYIAWFALVTVRRKTGEQYRSRSVESVADVKGRPTRTKVNMGHVCARVCECAQSDKHFLISVRSMDSVHHATPASGHRPSRTIQKMGQWYENEYH